MMRVFRSILLVSVMLLTGSCSDVAFQSQQGDDGRDTGKACEGERCPDSTGGYAWFEGKYGICSKPCGGGNQTQTVECRRLSDNVAVADSFCTGTKPPAARTCNVQACTSTNTWNWADWGDCSKTCGGGTKTRTVLCQDQNGTTVADNLCSGTKPATNSTCNTDPCTGDVTYDWSVTPGVCSVQCGGGTATDTVVCKKSDGSTVADSFCSAKPKPATTRTCNPDACPQAYTYAWEAQAWSTCTKDCGGGVQTRSVTCKRNDGVYVDVSYCPAASKPTTSQTCNAQACPTGGTPVTQTATVTPAQNLLDVILVVDDSNSMANDQAKLASRLSQFVNDLDALGIDYQICLTTTDITYYKGSPIKWSSGQYVLNKNTPNKSSVFVNTVNSLGAEWSSDEQGIKATYMMIRDFGPNSGTGCFRPKATLTVIEISDEDERSVGGNQALSQAQYQPLTAENMPDNLIALVRSTFDSSGFVKPFIWNSIIVRPGDTACQQKQDAEGNGAPSFQGALLAQLSNKTNGQIASICDEDYAQNMKLIKDRVVNSMPGLTLQCVPTDSPQVSFNPPFTTSVTRTGDQLKFNPALPENTQVTVRYTCP